MKPFYKILLIIVGAIVLTYGASGFRSNVNIDQTNLKISQSKSISKNISGHKFQIDWDLLREKYGIELTLKK